MSTESTIVIRSRMALKTGDKMRINPPDSIVRMGIFFLDGERAESLEEWLEVCRKKGIEDVKFESQLENIKREPFGSSYKDDNVICIWKDKKATRFRYFNDYRGGKGYVAFCEEPFEGDISVFYDVDENIEPYKKNLLDLMNLVDEINDGSSRGFLDIFRDRFEEGYKILEGNIKPNLLDIQDYVSDISDEVNYSAIE